MRIALLISLALVAGCTGQQEIVDMKIPVVHKEWVEPVFELGSAADPVDEVIEEVAEKAPVKNAIIEVETASWCGPCQKFKRECKQALIDQGWTVVELPAGDAVPRFTVWVRGESTTWTGYSSRSGFCSRLRSLL